MQILTCFVRSTCSSYLVPVVVSFIVRCCCKRKLQEPTFLTHKKVTEAPGASGRCIVSITLGGTILAHPPCCTLSQAIGELEKVLEFGRMHVNVLYTFRSVSRAIPMVSGSGDPNKTALHMNTFKVGRGDVTYCRVGGVLCTRVHQRGRSTTRLSRTVGVVPDLRFIVVSEDEM